LIGVVRFIIGAVGRQKDLGRQNWCENNGIFFRLSITYYQTWWFKMI
jgi:hypothetical protein